MLKLFFYIMVFLFFCAVSSGSTDLDIYLRISRKIIYATFMGVDPAKVAILKNQNQCRVWFGYVFVKRAAPEL